MCFGVFPAKFNLETLKLKIASLSHDYLMKIWFNEIMQFADF